MRGRAIVVMVWCGAITTLSWSQDSTQTSGLTVRVPWATSRIKGTPEPPPPYRTERVFSRLKFNEPLELTAAPGSSRLFVAERFGKVYSFPNDPNADRAELLIDLGKVVYGLAFHPRFATNGQFFVTYVVDSAKEEPRGTRVSRFHAADRLHANTNSEEVILEYPSGGHNGGCLRFGPDGHLYIATGDSSGIADGLMTGQDLRDLSGAILRIDVDHRAGETPYRIPPDNPFVNVDGARAEVWAYGLRQPWKMHFDSATGDLWTGNVGQDLWEQILLIERGGNYGWSVMEGSHPFRPDRPRGPTPFLDPVVEHDHADFRSITGGTVYHGERLADLRGAYIYADYDTGKIWKLRYDRSKKQVTQWRELVDSSLRIVGFGEDASGELYLVDHMGGGLHRLVPNTMQILAADFPRQLSQTGLFHSTAEHAIAAGVIRYSVVAPQWLDGAVKDRFFAVPGESKIEFDAVTYPQPAPGAPPGWRFPDGAVLAETISLELEPGKPASRRRLETRILHYEQLPGTEEVGDQFWRGYTYVWNDEQTDAVLQDAGGADRTFVLADAAAPSGKRSQTWHFPSRAECTICHNMAAKYVLGLTTLQANRDQNFGGKIANQLRTFDHLGLFTQPLPKPLPDLTLLADYRDTSPDLDRRARSYLHANCSHCHRKWGGGNTEFQLLAPVPLSETGIADVRPAHGGFDVPDARILAAHDPLRSVLFYRMAKLGHGRMPRLGSDVVDELGVQLIHDWIASLPATSGAAVAESKDEALLAVLRNSPERTAGLLETTPNALRLMLLIDRGQLTAELRDRVLSAAAASPESHIRDLFEKYLPEEQRPKRLGSSIKPETLLAMNGDAREGRRLYLEAAGVQCRSCHRIQGQGAEVGPDLSQIGKKYDRSKLLDNILNPSREIDPKYVVYLAETMDGRLHTGLLVERTATTVILKDGKNNLLRLPTSDVEQLTPQQRSLMPDLLLREMTAQQVADMLAFLSALK